MPRPTQTKLNRAAPRDMQVGARPPLYKPGATGESLEHLIPSRVDSTGGAHPVTPEAAISTDPLREPTGPTLCVVGLFFLAQTYQLRRTP